MIFIVFYVLSDDGVGTIFKLLCFLLNTIVVQQLYILGLSKNLVM